MKLYLRQGGRITRYHEAWIDDGMITLHWGKLGTRGATARRRLDPALSKRKNLLKHLGPFLLKGYRPIKPSRGWILEVVYKTGRRANKTDRAKLDRLEERLDDKLGWFGLGCCYGGSIGGGTMEVNCEVVDFDLAKKFVVKTLRGTEFADYAEINRLSPY